MTISFDPSLLLSWYNAKAGVPSSASGALTNPNAATAPKPPWVGSSTASTSSTSSSAATLSFQAQEQANTLASGLLNGQPLILPKTTGQSTGANLANAATNKDYSNLFALYQGLSSLQQLASAASSSTTSNAQLATLQKAFVNGVGQVQAFLGINPFSEFSLADGTAAATAVTTGANVPSETDTYQTPPIYTGDLNTPVPSLSGAVAFTASVKLANGSTKTVNFNLADLGATPRTLPNVVSYINDQLKAAGLTTRVADVRIPGQPQTVTSNGSTYTLPAPADSFALKINGSSLEQLTFSGASPQPAVYVSQTSGSTASTTSVVNGKVVTTPGVNSQVITALAANPAAPATGNQIYSNNLGANTAGPAYQATGPDGSLYVVSNATATGTNGEILAGPQNVVLTKYDSAGNTVYSQVLGTAGSATGYSIAVSPDGSKVAVAGSITGALNASDGTITQGQADTFVSVYNAATGENSWTTRAGTSGGADNPTGVAFAANGSVYVSGQTSAALPGQSLHGAQDGFVQAFSATGVAGNAIEFGTGTINSTAGVAVSGDNVVVAGSDGGQAVVRTFAISGADTLTAGATRVLGSGSVAGVSVAADGSIVVAGSTSTGALNAGAVTQAYSGGKEAFVADLSATGQASASDSVAYYSAGGATTASAVTTAGGLVYIAGQVAGPVTASSNGLPSHTGFVTAIDPTTGQAVWTNSLLGSNGQDLPNSIAVDTTGASALNALGLPSQTINYAPPTTLIDTSSVQAGDKFSVTQPSGLSQTVTISATDTLQTLATKIEQASQNNLTASVTIGINGEHQLTIKPVNNRINVTLNAGPPGADALGPLGLSPGVLAQSETTYATVSKTSNLKTSPYALGLSANLNLDTPAGIAQAQKELAAAQNVVQAIYSDMTTAPAPSTPSGSSGTVPAYITAQIADYQNALARLQGASGSSTSSPTTVLSLFS